MIPVREWLPANALRDGVLTARVAEAVNAWADRWFAEPRRGTVRLSFGGGEGAPKNSSMCWENSDGGAFLLTVDRGPQIEIAGAMLGASPPADPTNADLVFIRNLVSPCLEDLARAAGALFGTASDLRRVSGVRNSLTQSEKTLKFSVLLGASLTPVIIYVDERSAIWARKSVAPRDESARPLAARREAIALQPLRLGARVGESALTLADLRALAPGDIVVVERALADDMEMAIDGAIQAGLRCTLHTHGDTVGFKLTRTQGAL